MGKCEFEGHAGEAVGSGEEPKSFEKSIRAVEDIDRSIAAAEERLANLTAQRDSAMMFVLQETATIADLRFLKA